MKKKIFQITFLSLVLSFGFTNCSKSEPSCGFLKSSDGQRVSWGGKPLKLYVHETFPRRYYPSLRKAAAEWNRFNEDKPIVQLIFGAEHCRTQDEENCLKGDPQLANNNSTLDGFSALYWVNVWAPSDTTFASRADHNHGQVSYTQGAHEETRSINLLEQGRTANRWRGGSLQEADVYINGNFNFFSEGPGEDRKILPEQLDLVSLLVHEIGHALGLNHNGDSRSVMYPSLGSGIKRQTPLLTDFQNLTCEYSGGEWLLE